MNEFRLIVRRVALLAFAAFGGPLQAQTNVAVSSWIRLDAPLGNEAATAATLMRALPGWRSDQWGNLTKTTGTGTPRRVVACGLDYSAYVVSETRIAATSGSGGPGCRLIRSGTSSRRPSGSPSPRRRAG